MNDLKRRDSTERIQRPIESKIAHTETLQVLSRSRSPRSQERSQAKELTHIA